MKISKIIGVSAMAMLLATLMVSAASAAGPTYDTAEFITVPDGDIKVFGPYSSAQEEWWQFSAAVGDRIYIDLDYTFTQDGGKE